MRFRRPDRVVTTVRLAGHGCLNVVLECLAKGAVKESTRRASWVLGRGWGTRYVWI